jgi:glutamate--cysteine ligase
MAREVPDDMTIRSRNDVVAWFEDGSKTRAQFRIGTEHEKTPFFRADRRPVPYDGQNGIHAILEGMEGLLGWEPIWDGGSIIGLYDVRQDGPGGAISLEPGGQFELSGAPVETIHQTCSELQAHLMQVKQIADPLGIGFLSLGHSPVWTRAETPVMPKSRYHTMVRVLPRADERGLDMMFRTCTVQANLDYASEADMVLKLRVALALQPIATALFANSPFTEGKPNGFLSMRSEIWRHTDPRRGGMLPFVFEEGMGFDRYVDYAIDLPIYFLKRGSYYHEVGGATFRDLIEGRVPGFSATMADWTIHLSTIFPEVRLKRYLETRGADAGPRDMIAALPALFAGLLYDDGVLDQAWQMVKDWSAEERQSLRDAVPREGLKATLRNRSARDISRDVLALAHEGLARRARKDERGQDERIYLAPLDDIVESGRTRAEILLDRFHGSWRGSVDPVYDEMAY